MEAGNGENYVPPGQCIYEAGYQNAGIHYGKKASPAQAERIYTLMGSASEPAGLLDSPKEPLSGNLVLQVTPYTPLQLRGWAAELPRSDFNLVDVAKIAIATTRKITFFIVCFSVCESG